MRGSESRSLGPYRNKITTRETGVANVEGHSTKFLLGPERAWSPAIRRPAWLLRRTLACRASSQHRRNARPAVGLKHARQAWFQLWFQRTLREALSDRRGAAQRAPRARPGSLAPAAAPRRPAVARPRPPRSWLAHTQAQRRRQPARGPARAPRCGWLAHPRPSAPQAAPPGAWGLKRALEYGAHAPSNVLNILINQVY
jgi:hypothetical protein